ncbi:uncharacterized protein N7483_000830 [Penicillium malachiteum]|uniref:uncharacterized protein n=1 Tax=Penicillium malachiteum TaxID=1324776 RepID=UPI0025488B6F|nr:uncharacterized protein N7483_000830 [Penicillium malachiteum]KAJ5735705.1 hypothetical protein N7483_000830 [Penicillium malachiteum]
MNMRPQLVGAIWTLLVGIEIGVAATKPDSSLAHGFADATYGSSSNGSATCVAGLISVPATSVNTKILLDEPANQTVVTEIIQENFQASSTISDRTDGGNVNISGTYNIEATLCVPKHNPEASTIQILSHGIGLDQSYWDIATGYSYVDSAANAGYATLAYNRLGVGASDHPDAIQVVQAPMDVAILHGITSLLRSGSIGTQAYSTVIGTGHSYGSIIQLGQNVKYPQDVNATVITSFTTNFDYLPYTVFANNPAIANQVDGKRFENLSNGYLITDTSISFQLPFFRWPYFDTEIYQNQYEARNTYTVGQQLTLSGIVAVASSYTGPVSVVVGQYDFPFCGGNCSYSTNQAAEALSSLYPAAAESSQTYLVPNAGHVINAHYSAPDQFMKINNFLSSQGF